MSIEYNDFGFTAMDADELASVDTKIIEKTTTATEVINNLDNFIRPLLENLAKDSDKEYIYWPNRIEIINKKIQELDEIQKNL
jgi:RNA binding exosome subunit